MYVLEHNAILTTVLFVALIMLIYLAVFTYLRKCTNYFGGNRKSTKSNGNKYYDHKYIGQEEHHYFLRDTP